MGIYIPTKIGEKVDQVVCELYINNHDQVVQPLLAVHHQMQTSKNLLKSYLRHNIANYWTYVSVFGGPVKFQFRTLISITIPINAIISSFEMSYLKFRNFIVYNEQHTY